MKRFHSYGPVDSRTHFTVPRTDLVQTCLESLVGDAENGGHYFTIFAPRQSGKTWLMRQVKGDIEALHEDRFSVGAMSMQGVIMEETDADALFFRQTVRLFSDAFGIDIDAPTAWDDWVTLFSLRNGVFPHPVILFIDEFDSLPQRIIDRLTTLFRDMYLNRETYRLHGLALIGVRAVLGVGSRRGSPFNIQRSLHVPNFTASEVEDLFSQYEKERGQKVEDTVVQNVYEATNGQPGLVCWFGELLTEKYNPGDHTPLDHRVWKRVWRKARFTEPNNTVMNLIAKARDSQYRERVMAIFARDDLPFSFHDPICNHLYLNGVIIPHTQGETETDGREVCRFSSPFIQSCLYSAFGMEMTRTMPVRPLQPLDDLSDVLDGPDLNLSGLMDRYQDYLNRLKANGHDIWSHQARRTDLRIREAAGHFHLYAWLYNAIGSDCHLSPEFPTGNGQVDLLIQCGEKWGIIEIKSFSTLRQMKLARHQAAHYAARLGLDSVMVVIFLSDASPDALDSLSGEESIDGVRVRVRAIDIG
jgi:hypothetical protein